ncbi:MAG: 4a-hydroxytetrahydrobiopterin dehydratase [Actinobacteria bacterium]|nr:4a-hydroxytetrahydrobiopterin dehydratase [Actinomycetota bacterium]
MSLLTDAEIDERLAALSGWRRDGAAIVRTFDRGDFQGAVDFLNSVTVEAERANHHPDVAISWKEITFTISTHSQGGLTAADFALAAAIDALA